MTKSESTTSAASSWTEQWANAQKAYWQSWQQLMQGQGGDNPWANALQNWCKAAGGVLDSDTSNTYARMMDQGRTFFSLGQQMNELFKAMMDSSAAGSKWQDILKERFEAMKTSMALHENSEWADSLKHMAAFYEMPLDTLRRMCSGASMMPGDFLQVFRSQIFEGMGEKLHADVDKFLSVPGVGYTRESQEQMQQLARMLLDYQRATQDYINAHAKLSADALDRLYERIAGIAKRGEKVTSLRQFYDLWVDANEEVYNRFAMSSEFQKLYAEMVNALMRVKQHARTIVDEMLAAFNMPTRREMNTLLKRQHELKREIRNLRHPPEDQPPPRGRREREDDEHEDLQTMRSDLATLRSEVAALRMQFASSGNDKRPENTKAVNPLPEMALPRKRSRVRSAPETAKSTRTRRAAPAQAVSKKSGEWNIDSLLARGSANTKRRSR